MSAHWVHVKRSVKVQVWYGSHVRVHVPPVQRLPAAQLEHAVGMLPYTCCIRLCVR